MSTGNNLFIFVGENKHSCSDVCPVHGVKQHADIDPKIQWRGLLDIT